MSACQSRVGGEGKTDSIIFQVESREDPSFARAENVFGRSEAVKIAADWQLRGDKQSLQIATDDGFRWPGPGVRYKAIGRVSRGPM